MGGGAGPCQSSQHSQVPTVLAAGEAERRGLDVLDQQADHAEHQGTHPHHPLQLEGEAVEADKGGSGPGDGDPHGHLDKQQQQQQQQLNSRKESKSPLCSELNYWTRAAQKGGEEGGDGENEEEDGGGGDHSPSTSADACGGH